MLIFCSLYRSGKIGRDQQMLWPCFHLKKFVGACVIEKLEDKLKRIQITIKCTLVNETLHISMNVVFVRCKDQRTLNLSLLLNLG